MSTLLPLSALHPVVTSNILLKLSTLTLSANILETVTQRAKWLTLLIPSGLLLINSNR